MREEILNWWKQAKRDLVSARHALEAGDYYLVVFLCHQAVEKGLKAHIMKNERLSEFGMHSLIFLGKRACLPEKFHTFLRQLTPQYTLTRYPDAGSEPPYELYDKAQAEDFLRKAREVIAWIGKQLG